MTEPLDSHAQRQVRISVDHFLRDAEIRSRASRGNLETTTDIERRVQAQLAHLPPAAVQLAVAEELARAQEKRRAVWIRFAQARGTRLPWEHTPEPQAIGAHDAVESPRARARDEDNEFLHHDVPRVLVAVDGSAPSMRAVQLAAHLASAWHVILEIVSVVDLPADHGIVGGTMMRQGFHDEAREAVLLAAKAHVSKNVVVELRVLHGRCATVLLQEASMTGVAFFVLGRRGRGDPAATYPGSISQAASAHATVPVVIVP